MKRRCQHFIKRGKMCEYTGYACAVVNNKNGEELACYWHGFPKKQAGEQE
jgi:hypothetical protein